MKDLVAGAERQARDREASLAAEKEKATHQVEESTVEVACMKG